MTSLFGRHRFGHPGSSPGINHHPATCSDAQPTSVSLIAYGPDRLEERAVGDDEDLAAARRDTGVVWINVTGLADVARIGRIGALFGLHTLALEDVVNVGQRPKAEEYDDHRYIVLKLLRATGELEVEQISIFFGRGFVVTVQERPGDVFDGVRERIRKGRSRIRGSGADYLAYALIDSLVDQFFPILEDFGERLEAIEEELIDQPTADTLQQIYEVRRALLMLRRAAWPQREVVNCLERDDSGLIERETKVFLRDCYDHTVQSLEMIETYRELAAGMLDVYLSSISNRMNEVMKVLTIMATIFIPLTFIAGIYGMNFSPQASRWNMPELNWVYGYPMALGIMAVVGIGMVMFFRRKGWF
jgi:magnesium transporter